MTRSSFILTFLKAETDQIFEKAEGFESFQDFCEKRKTALDELKTKEECPGEHTCTTNREVGICARQGLQIETYCKADRCRLYFTKRGSTPREYEAPLEAAIRLLERKLSDFENPESELSLYEVRAKIEFDRADRIVENIKSEERDKDSQDQQTKGQPGRGFIKGDSTAFAFTDEQLKEMYAARERRQRKRKEKKLEDQLYEET